MADAASSRFSFQKINGLIVPLHHSHMNLDDATSANNDCDQSLHHRHICNC